jgi:signal transduction histidine kinase
LEQLRGASPGRLIELETAGDSRGFWDGPRLQQVLRNLVTNAIVHGAADAPIRVMLTGAKNSVAIEVKNKGPAIEKEIVDRIFDPLTQGVGQANKDDSTGGLGLGLYIVREIALAHGGEVNVHSDNSETVFIVSLPRQQ